MRLKTLFFFILPIILLTYTTFWQSLDFDFWRDDWAQIWQVTSSQIPLKVFLENSAFNLHPGIVYEEVFLSKLFNQNSFLWNIEGIFLKSLGALSLSLMLFGMTKSKKVALYSGLIYATFPGGMESVTWLSAHAVALVVIQINLGMFFWVSSNEIKKSKKRYLASLLFFTLAIISDPGRGVLSIPMAFVWDLLTIFQSFFKKKFTSFISRQIPLFLIPLFAGFFVTQRADYEQIKTVFLHIQNAPTTVFISFISSIGNLLIGWMNLFYRFDWFNKPSLARLVPPHNLTGISNISFMGVLAGISLIIITILLLFIFLKTKRKSIQIFLYFCLWIPLHFLPNFLFQNHMVIGGTIIDNTHRYLTLSAVGFSGFLGYLLSFIKKPRLINLVFILIITLNVLTVNNILEKEWPLRSRKIVESLWDKIDRDVPKGEKNSIFIYLGEDQLRLVALDWSGSIPFGLRRNFHYPDEFPITTTDKEIILKLLCGQETLRPSAIGWTHQQTKIPLSNLHAWELNNGVLKNVSQNLRQIFSQETKCQQ